MPNSPFGGTFRLLRGLEGQDRLKFKVFHAGASEPKKIVEADRTRTRLNRLHQVILLYRVRDKGKSQRCTASAHRIAVTTTASFNDPFQKLIHLIIL